MNISYDVIDDGVFDKYISYLVFFDWISWWYWDYVMIKDLKWFIKFVC